MTATNPVGTRSDFGSDGGRLDGTGSHATHGHTTDDHVSERFSIETKASTKTTEFMV